MARSACFFSAAAEERTALVGLLAASSVRCLFSGCASALGRRSGLEHAGSNASSLLSALSPLLLAVATSVRSVAALDGHGVVVRAGGARRATVATVFAVARSSVAFALSSLAFLLAASDGGGPIFSSTRTSSSELDEHSSGGPPRGS